MKTGVRKAGGKNSTAWTFRHTVAPDQLLWDQRVSSTSAGAPAAKTRDHLMRQRDGALGVVHERRLSEDRGSCRHKTDRRNAAFQLVPAHTAIKRHASFYV